MKNRSNACGPEDSYKEIPVTVPGVLSLKEEAALHDLFSRYPEEELTYVVSNGRMTVFLHTLDVQSFRDDIAAIREKFNSSPLAAALDDALNRIMAIKSYGVKNNRRVYVGYNRERKVKDRKSKELNRNQHYYANDSDFSNHNNALPPEGAGTTSLIARRFGRRYLGIDISKEYCKRAEARMAAVLL